MKVIKIELVTNLGTFKFQDNHNSTADAYQAMCHFEHNNWKMFSEIKYVVTSEIGESEVENSFSGMNAGAELSAFLGLNDDLEYELKSQY